VSPEGTIYSWTRTWHPFGGLEAVEKPFLIAVVELQAAGKIRLAGLMDESDTVHIGQKVSGEIGTTLYDGRDVPAIRWHA
tara:strand:- start:204 stop:443 length:240 start_codon:yes stop_codon:yes gene_type:complete